MVGLSGAEIEEAKRSTALDMAIKEEKEEALAKERAKRR